ncbi:hypothetical protein HUK80_15580 [Flavobacterium sp. MAH-1]|uniref:DoxX family membrane protein n=1 Tax=Flavobacterium agri TaxID=2743471 RepID=A0A7Y9C7G0_9FLAO|nr:hypothetical protein [Flavobacterium agri]NUY82325.1 hypothetical protein [Flavobacterium agri]NYA72349.1 hypothetical protein [Flavobacterium agri]
MKTKLNKPQRWAKNLLGFMMVMAGTGHLTFARLEFQAQVPNWVPMDKDLVVILSGIVEVAFGLSLIFWNRYRTQIGWTLALFFVLVFPGNVAQYLNRHDAFGLNSDGLRLARLFFQPVLIGLALWSTGAWQSWRNRN